MAVADLRKRLQRLPSVDAVLRQPEVTRLLAEHPRSQVVAAVRRVLEAQRRLLRKRGGKEDDTKIAVPASEVRLALAQATRARLRPVINATGVVLHTNLGRSPLPRRVVEHLARLSGGFCNLELDLSEGERGERQAAVHDLLCELSGAGGALVVNNNAAAVFLMLRVLAANREAIVSRGQQVEIGGSFRVPDVMRASGARMVEVGTTNKTHLFDYERAIGPDTALILSVHRSNFALVGFTEEPALEALATLARSRGLLLLFDLGTATLLDPVPPELPGAPSPQAALRAGVSLVCFSGDKLLGGPQCGILLGDAALIAALARDPMARALRVGRLTLAALEATLRLYQDPAAARREIPVLRMLLMESAELKRRARALQRNLRRLPGVESELVPTVGQVGGGSLPELSLPGFGVALRPAGCSAQTLARWLRQGEPAVLGRLHQERLVLDVRTLIDDSEVGRLSEAVAAALERRSR